MSDDSSNFEKLKAAYLNCDEMQDKKYYADWLERDIQAGRIDGAYHLENLLQELEGYPLSQTVIDYICELVQDAKFKSTTHENDREHAKMLCVFLPAYERARARYEKRRKPGSPSPREAAIVWVFSGMMRKRRISESTIIDLMRQARKFARENKVENYLIEARKLRRYERQELADELMAEL